MRKCEHARGGEHGHATDAAKCDRNDWMTPQRSRRGTAADYAAAEDIYNQIKAGKGSEKQ